MSTRDGRVVGARRSWRRLDGEALADDELEWLLARHPVERARLVTTVLVAFAAG